MEPNNKFDPVTLEYAMKRNILDKIDKRYKSMCVFFLEQIDKAIKAKCKTYSKKHKQCDFELDDSHHGDDASYSIVSLTYNGEKLLDFEYGFDYGIKIKNGKGMKPSKDGVDFFVDLELLPAIMGDARTLKKYSNTIESYLAKANLGYVAHDNDNDDDVYFYKHIIPVDKNWKIIRIKKAVIEAFDDLFKEDKRLNLFTKEIPKIAVN